MILDDTGTPPREGRPLAPWKSRVLTRIPPNRLTEILDIAEDGIVTVDAGQQIVLFNRGASKLFGYEPDEVAGKSLDLLIPKRFRPPHQGQVAAFGQSAETARPMGGRRSVWGLRKDGSEFPAEVSISKFADGDGLLFTAIVRDVTERTRYEADRQELERLRTDAKLSAAESQYRRIVETANEGIWELDADARVTFVNLRMTDLLGYPPDEIVGRHKWDFLFEEDLPTVRELFERRRAGVSEQADVRFRHRGGGAVWTLMSARPVTDQQGGFRGALDMFTDITDRRKAEDGLRDTTRQLWQAARLAGVGELAASIAHELNNPLATVSLRVEQLLGKTAAEDGRRRSLEIVGQEVERMAGLVGNLLQFSRAGRDQVSTVDVQEEIVRTIELVGPHLRKRGIRVEPEFAPGVPTIHADRQQLRQVFLNLFTNAADAMPAGGRLTPRVRSGPAAKSRPGVVVEVADTGAGIPANLLAHVFDPFFTTKEDGKGTGLGLAICKRIVAQHHGTLEIESEVNKGTTIRMTLPVRPDTNVVGLRESNLLT
ncbi:PAS domain-containing sensor histidine kinase [Limnoglobus roseus]|uniref:histidine kinase n=1 Tax=Limnoglobus roseus TaxID=2598579 RepID=A0A5C1AFH6_9BACT|nr:PAS domain S-box protein [Limnoglobus roseus]QEL16726.1 PAS domain S-box protein [Limnoglobus roseus]